MSGELASFEVDGYQLVYQDLGEGTPVLLVHGSLCDYRYWQWQLRSLGEHHRLIVPSLRHYYPERWDGQGADFTSARHVADLLALKVRPTAHFAGKPEVYRRRLREKNWTARWPLLDISGSSQTPGP